MGDSVVFKGDIDDYRLGEWSTWMLGVSYFNEGMVHEKGGYFTKPSTKARVPEKDYNGRGKHETEIIVQSERVDGARVRYRFGGKTYRDPIINWYGIESYEGQVDKLRFFQTSQRTRHLLCGYSKGQDFSEHDKAPAIERFWARSHYGKPEEMAELYFPVTSPEMLQEVADFYGLPVPCSAEMLEELHDPFKYRTRAYWTGEKKGDERVLVPMTTASVIQTNRRSRRLILYTFIRPWEFEDYFELPDF